jgi:hypothetical protein
LRPFRFFVVGDSQRASLAELFAAGAAQRGQSAEEVERARARAFNGPGLAALIARVRDDVPDVPSHEQWLCVGAALMNFLNALHLMGFGAKALSGASVSDQAVSSAFCGPGERLASWVIAGRPTHALHPKGDILASAVIGDWQGSARHDAAWPVTAAGACTPARSGSRRAAPRAVGGSGRRCRPDWASGPCRPSWSSASNSGG